MGATDIDVRRTLPLHLTWAASVVMTWRLVTDRWSYGWGWDSHAYWMAWHRDGLYAVPPGAPDAFNYSPAVAQLLWPLAQLPWPVFATVWSLAAAVAFAWLLAPLALRWRVPLMVICFTEVAAGNVFWLIALVVALTARVGSRPAWGGLWSVVLLAKLTPALGPIWFAGRRQWRALAWSVGATAVVVVLSVATVPQLWPEWLAFVWDSRGVQTGLFLMVPWTWRLPAALVLVAWGSVTDRRWTLPVAVVLACPILGDATFTVLAALPRLRTPTDEPAGSTSADEHAVLDESTVESLPRR